MKHGFIRRYWAVLIVFSILSSALYVEYSHAKGLQLVNNTMHWSSLTYRLIIKTQNKWIVTYKSEADKYKAEVDKCQENG